MAPPPGSCAGDPGAPTTYLEDVTWWTQWEAVLKIQECRPLSLETLRGEPSGGQCRRSRNAHHLAWKHRVAGPPGRSDLRPWSEGVL
jgi:hypothetical protein